MIASLSPRELAAALRSPTPPLLLDVREPAEHALVTLPGATLIPLGQLPARLAELAEWKTSEVVVFCHHGIRSQHAIAFLQQHGFTRLRNLSGGIDRWADEVQPDLPRC